MFRDRYHDISTAFSFCISRFEYDVPLIIVRLIVEEIMIFDFLLKSFTKFGLGLVTVVVLAFV